MTPCTGVTGLPVTKSPSLNRSSLPIPVMIQQTLSMTTMSKPIEEILAPKPVARPPRIYAYPSADEAHEGLLKIGQTMRNVKQRIAEQLKTAAIKNFKIELDEPAEC